MKETFDMIHYMETQTEPYMVKNQKLFVKLELIPSDMKFISIVSGELHSQTSRYPLPYCNVLLEDLSSIDANVSQWNYHKRLSDVRKVDDFKKKKPNAKRNDITEFIGNKLHSRQEKEPFIGKYVDVVKPEPLHLKNNGFQFLNSKLLHRVIEKSEDVIAATTDFSELPDCSFKRYCDVLEEVHANKLLSAIKSWFESEIKYKKSSEICSSFRFNGETSGKISRCFAR